MSKTTALIVAAGSGTRAADPRRGRGTPKQYQIVAGRPLLLFALETFLEHRRIDEVRVVISAADRPLYDAAVAHLGADFAGRLGAPIIGGATRQASVKAGLDALAAGHTTLVLIHDAARPYTTPAMLDRLLDELLTCRGAVLASPATDTIKQATPELLIGKTLPRERLWRAETPQGFRFKDIVAAHRQAARDTSASFTDDASIAEWAGIPVSLVDSGGLNTKITTAEDLAMAELRLGSKSRHAPADIRTGQGFDVHRFKDSGDHVWLCGVRIPFHRGVEAHSDGDVALHALTDALLGAIADGDIGQHFSNNDPRWRNAASRLFVSDAVARVGRRGGLLRHVDITILAEAPKIGPHREAMRAEVARLTGLSLDRVGLKATTTEQLGFVGRGDGLAALATATVAM